MVLSKLELMGEKVFKNIWEGRKDQMWLQITTKTKDVWNHIMHEKIIRSSKK